MSWKDNINIDFTEIGPEDFEWNYLKIFFQRRALVLVLFEFWAILPECQLALIINLGF
jgi:hypothetical protein